MKRLIIGFLLIATGCAFSKDDSTVAERKQMEQDSLVQEQFSPVTGTYVGTIKYSNATQQVRLILKIVREPNGYDSNGKALFKDVAKGIYKKIDPMGTDQTLLASYDPRTNNLSLTKPTNAGGPNATVDDSGPEDVSYIQATITGQRLVGTMNAVNGGSAPIDLVLTTRETGTGSPENENYERIKAEVSQIVGIYRGTLADPKADHGQQRIKISLSMLDISNTITLNALYQREDIPSGVVDLSLTTTYKLDVNPRMIAFSGRGGGTYFLDIAGPIAKNPKTNLYEINAVVNLRGSFLGRTLLKQEPPAAPKVSEPLPPRTKQ